MGTFDTAASVNTYAPFRVIIEWDTTFTGDPDSMNIVLTNSGFKPHDGTLAWYDDLSFYYDNTGLSQPIVDYFNHVFPNPCQGQLNVHTTKGTGISIIDITGNIIYQTIATNDLVHIDLSGKATGLYFLKQQNANGIHTSKVILR